MAFGLSPRYSEEFYLDNFTAAQFLVIAVESARRLNWKLTFISNSGFIAYLQDKDSRLLSELKFSIEGNLAAINSKSIGSGVFRWGLNQKNVEQFTDTLIDIKYAFKPEELDQKFENLKTELDTSLESNSVLPENVFFSIFIPKQGYYVTPAIFLVNSLIFIIMIASGIHFFMPDAEGLLSWGANFRPATQNGEWWRLFTSCFLHFGIIHLLMNMYALLYIGMLLEPRIGSGKFAAAYLIAGISGSITSFWWHDLTVSAGASGAIFGMYGVFLALLSTNLIEKETRKALFTSIGIFVLFNLANGLKDGIDNAAHIGGLVGGLIIGFTFYPSLIKPDLKIRNLAIHSAGLFFILAISLLLIQKTSDTLVKYDLLMNDFAAKEEKAMSLYKLPSDASDARFLNVIQDEGLPNWKECITVLNRVDSLPDLPEEMKYSCALMKKYCDYRIISYILMEESIKNKTHVFDNQVEAFNQKIDLIIRKLNGEIIPDAKIEINPLEEFVSNVPSNILYVVDGVPVNCKDSIRQNEIVSVLVVSPEKSEPLYGEKGKSGAVFVKTLNDFKNGRHN